MKTGFPGAGPHCHPNSGAGERHAAHRGHAASAGPFVNGGGAADKKIEGFASSGTAGKPCRQVAGDAEAVAGGTLKFGADLRQNGRDRPGRPEAQLPRRDRLLPNAGVQRAATEERETGDENAKSHRDVCCCPTPELSCKGIK
jgi:hypothetical protein